ncbi:MAG: AAA family ATPase [Vicinamibacterales bacterium]
MRIAVSGSHRTGKSTLVAAMAAAMPAYAVVEEPYHLMEEDGYLFSHPPSVEDFEAQLERSIREVREAGPDTLFDRCPVDLLAYLAVHDDASSADVERWLPAVRAAVGTLDAVVLVPVEACDRIARPSGDDDGDWREKVDETLRERLVEDSCDLALKVIEVEGDVARRLRTVLRTLDLPAGAEVAHE